MPIISRGVLRSSIVLFTVLIGVMRAQHASADEKTDRQKLRTIARVSAAEGFFGAVLVTEKGRPLLDEGVGRLGATRMRPNDRFWIASISKSFTATAVLKCLDQRLFNLDDTASKFFQNVPQEKANITVLQLLTHQSGLPQSYAAEEITDRDKAVHAILGEPLAAKPGTKFSYSNSNYELLAAIVETAAGKPFQDYVQNEILRPAALRDTGFWFEKGADQVIPTAAPLPPRLRHKQWELGAGGMYSTTSDLARFYRALKSGKIISPTSTDRLFQKQIKIQEGWSGLGWFIGATSSGNERIFTRGNDSFGPNGLVYIYPQREVVIVVLTHAGDKSDDASWSRVVLADLESALKL